MATVTSELTAADREEMVATRRDFHQHPELGFEEKRTSARVVERLRALGLSPRSGIGRTGVVAEVRGGKPGRSVLLRADMDALPIQEESDVPYRSQNPGVMHACGHDCHTAILLSVAKVLARDAERLPGTVKLVFQPAEENGAGAKAMIADGVLGDAPPDAAFGLHVWQDMDLGWVGVTSGAFMAAVDEFEVTLQGKGAHAAHPELGIDPVTGAAHVVTALQTIVSRNVDPLKAAVVSVTQIRAGQAFNIIPERATLNGTVRVFDEQLWKELPIHFERVVKGVAQALGLEATVNYTRHNRPTVNYTAMAARAREAAAEVVGAGFVRDDLRTMGGEDFSDFLDRVPGCFIAVGSRNKERGLVYGHHHPRFDVDERSLEVGAEVLLRLTRRFLGAA
jgi:amidohydrolase